MKTVSNLNKQFVTIDGTPIDLTADLPATVKNLAVNMLSTATRLQAMEIPRAWDLAKKFKNAIDESIEIEDQDVDILHKAKNEKNYPVQVLIQFNESIK